MKKSIRTEIIINASKEKVWRILTDFKSYSSWNPFIVSIEGDLRTGGDLKNTLLNGDKKMVFKPKILKVVPNQYFEWKGVLLFAGLFDGQHYFEIEELNPHQIKFIHGENFNGVLVNFIIKRIGNETRINFIKMNEALKKLAEIDR